MIIWLIVLAIIGIISFIVLHVMAKRKVTAENARYLDKNVGSFQFPICRLLRWLIPGLIACIMVLSLLIGGIHILDTTERGVVKTFGRISDTVLEGGLRLVNPISDTVTIYDMTAKTHELVFESYTGDAQAITVTADIEYRLDPGRILEVAKTYGSVDVLDSQFMKVCEESIKSVISTYSAMPLLEDRANISPKAQTASASLEDVYPVIINKVVIRDIVFSDAFEASVEAKMTAEQDALRAEEEARKAIIEAERDRDVAKVQAEEAKTKAQGEADAKVIAAQGEADALEMTREALEKMPDTWIMQLFIERWDGKLPTYMLGEDTGVMISPGAVQ